MTDVRLTATNPEDSSVVYVACNAKGEMLLEEPIKFDGNLDGDLTVSGSASIAGNVASGSPTVRGQFLGNCPSSVTAASADAFVANYDGTTVARVKYDGSSIFADDKAGFTKDGHLWCTTRRGDTVILDATSNGLGTWADYTPPTRRDQAKEKLETLRDESNTISQDLPETEAGTP